MLAISIITNLIICILLVMNYKDTAGITILSSQIAQIFHAPPLTVTLNMSVYTLIIFALGEISAVFFFAPLYTSLKEKYNAYKRELEKSSISNSSNSSKVEVLEAKIATLEKALKDALNK